MTIRTYQPSDIEALHAMHKAQGLDYVEPNWNHPEFFSRLVAEDELGRVVMAIMGRLSAEMFMLQMPGAASPMQMIRNFLALHLASEDDMATKGIQDCFAEIPRGPEWERFKTLLARLGWLKAETWENWTKPQLHRNPTLPSAHAGHKLIGTGG